MKTIYHAMVAGAVSGLVSKGIEKYNIINMQSIYQTFIVELWPMWFGMSVFLIYIVIADYIKLRRFSYDVKDWIGIFKSKDYSNLKGKIKCYIREELENRSTNSPSPSSARET